MARGQAERAVRDPVTAGARWDMDLSQPLPAFGVAVGGRVTHAEPEADGNLVITLNGPFDITRYWPEGENPRRGRQWEDLFEHDILPRKVSPTFVAAPGTVPVVVPAEVAARYPGVLLEIGSPLWARASLRCSQSDDGGWVGHLHAAVLTPWFMPPFFNNGETWWWPRTRLPDDREVEVLEDGLMVRRGNTFTADPVQFAVQVFKMNEDEAVAEVDAQNAKEVVRVRKAQERQPTDEITAAWWRLRRDPSYISWASAAPKRDPEAFVVPAFQPYWDRLVNYAERDLDHDALAKLAGLLLFAQNLVENSTFARYPELDGKSLQALMNRHSVARTEAALAAGVPLDGLADWVAANRGY